MIARTSTRLAAAVAALALVAAACGGSSGSEADGEPQATNAAPEAPVESAEQRPDTTGSDETNDVSSDLAAGAIVPAALEFEADLVGGGTIDARTLAGMPTVFWFWAPT